MVRFYETGQDRAIVTDCRHEHEFVRECADALGELIKAKGGPETVWQTELEPWLPSMFDIACKLRGYKADVDEQRIITAGARGMFGEMEPLAASQGQEVAEQEAVVKAA